MNDEGPASSQLAGPFASACELHECCDDVIETIEGGRRKTIDVAPCRGDIEAGADLACRSESRGVARTTIAATHAGSFGGVECDARRSTPRLLRQRPIPLRDPLQNRRQIPQKLDNYAIDSKHRNSPF